LKVFPFSHTCEAAGVFSSRTILPPLSVRDRTIVSPPLLGPHAQEMVPPFSPAKVLHPLLFPFLDTERFFSLERFSHAGERSSRRPCFVRRRWERALVSFPPVARRCADGDVTFPTRRWFCSAILGRYLRAPFFLPGSMVLLEGRCGFLPSAMILCDRSKRPPPFVHVFLLRAGIPLLLSKTRWHVSSFPLFPFPWRRKKVPLFPFANGADGAFSPPSLDVFFSRARRFPLFWRAASGPYFLCCFEGEVFFSLRFT